MIVYIASKYFFFINIKDVDISGIRGVFDSRKRSDFSNGIMIRFLFGKIECFIISSGLNRLYVNIPATIFSTLTITYAGTSNANDINFYLDGNLISGKSILTNSLTSSITSDNNFKIFLDSFSPSRVSKGKLKHLSFVNYVKSPAERTEDFNNKKQSIGSGSWLLAPIEPIYKEQLKTLSTTDINNPLPNPTAFTNEQGYKLNLVGYPTTLVKGVDLIQI